MKLIAVDSFYTDETKHVSAKQAFEVSSEETAKDLIKRGLAKEHDSVTEVKSAPAPSNKTDKTPQNKAAPAPKNK